MKKIIDNKYTISETNVTELVKRVKALIINSNNEILLAYSNNTYQFPGGHVEDEKLIDALKREIKEETGIVLNNYDIEPFAVSYRYYKDYPKEGDNRKNEIYYYEIKTDEKPNLENTHYTEEEKKGNFELRYINLKDVESILKENALKYGDKKGIANEMFELMKVYKNN